MQTMINATKPSFLIVVFLLFACTPYQGNVSKPASNHSSNKQYLLSRNTDLGFCKLPGQLRKLGLANTYLTPGRIIKISQTECQTRGGVFAHEAHFVSVK